MFEQVLDLFQWNGWGIIENIFTAIGIASVIITIVRFIHERCRKEWKGNISIEDYSADCNVEELYKSPIYSSIWTNEPLSCMSTIVFRPVDCAIPKVKIYILDSKGEKYKREKKVYKNLTPESPLCFRIERAERLPRVKIRWYSDYGEYAEHFFEDNCRNEIDKVIGVEYHNSLVSILRRIFGLR